MSSNSMDDDDEPISPLLFEDNNEDYMEACDDEVNDMVSILERLRINDNEQMNLTSGFCTNMLPSSIKSFEAASTADSNYVVSPIFVDDISGKILNEVTKAVVGSKKSRSQPEETPQVFSTNMPVKTQDVNRKTSQSCDINMDQVDSNNLKIFDKTKDVVAESVDIAKPLDLSLKRNSDQNDAAFIHANPENKTELKSPMIVPDIMTQTRIDPETGEIKEISNSIHSDTSGNNSTRKSVDQSADETTSDKIFYLDSLKLSYSADISSDDQSQTSSGILIDSPPNSPNTGAEKTSVEDKSSRKVGTFVPPISGMSDIRKRRFSIFQQPSINIDASKTNSSSDEDSNNSRAFGKESPKNIRRASRKTVKFSPRPIVQNYSDVKNEENRTSSCKRKKTSSENMAETSGKVLCVRKRSISEHNSETCGNTHLLNRSRSLSPSLKKVHSTSITNPPTGDSSISQSRKRTNSDAHNANHAKSRKSSTSSDEVENK